MCGVNGFNFIDTDLINRMNKVLSHRGPDQEGIKEFNNLTLGHKRLAILDLSERGRQPFSDISRNYWIVYNGEVYNFKEIRKELESKGHRFISDTDTEVILNAYKEYGKDCLERFNGMFAFCIYDKKNNSLFLARDRLGIKPIYYYLKDERFIFSSEIKAILVHPLKREIDLDALDEFIALQGNFRGKTLFKGIHELLPGHFMTFDLNNNIAFIKRYWDIETAEKKKFNEEELIKNLKKSVEYRMISDVPLGVFLSGGLDSSAVTSLAVDIVGNKLNAFSAVYENKEFSEEKYAQIMVDHTDIRINKKSIDRQDFRATLKDAIWYNDYPLIFEASIPLLSLSKLTKENVTVVLSGEGSDEIFLGYNKYSKIPGFSINLNFGPLNLPALKALQAIRLASGDKTNVESMVLNDRLIMAYDQNYFHSYRRKSLYGTRLRDCIKEPTHYLKPILQKASKFNNKWDRYSYFELHTYLKMLLHKVDRMTMAHSIESRVPFLDHNFVEYVFSIDADAKVKYGLKGMLKKAFKGRIPNEIINRRKAGFLTPMCEWLQKTDFASKILNNSRLVRDQYFNKEYISKALKNNKIKDIFILLNLELWYRMFILEENEA